METGSINIWQILAGIGLFLFGMYLMEHAIRHLAGRAFKIFLRDQTSHPARAIFAGLIITAVLQSSSIVNLLVLAFVGAGVITMHSAIAVILGANLGSTVYNWIVVYLGFKFDIQAFAFPLIAICTIALIFFQNNKRAMDWSRLGFGLALLFIGLTNIKTGVESLVDDFDQGMLVELPLVVYALAGFLITAIVQSSSTTVVITLVALNAGILSFYAAAALVIGAELGTTIKIILGAVGTVPDKKRVALGNFIFNLVSSVIAFIFLKPLAYLVTEIIGFRDQLVSLVCFQSVVNLSGIIIFYPFLKKMGTFLERRFKTDGLQLTRHLNPLLVQDPDEAIKAIELESNRLLTHIVSLNMEALEAGILPSTETEKFLPAINSRNYSEKYELVKQHNAVIIDYCLLLQRSELKEPEQQRLNQLMIALRQAMLTAKSIKDIRHNIKDYRDSANDLLHDFYKRIRKDEKVYYDSIIDILAKQNPGVIDLDDLLNDSKTRHDKTLSEIFHLAETNKIADVEMATLINVFGEIHASHDSLIQSMKEIFKVDREAA